MGRLVLGHTARRMLVGGSRQVIIRTASNDASAGYWVRLPTQCLCVLNYPSLLAQGQGVVHASAIVRQKPDSADISSSSWAIPPLDQGVQHRLQGCIATHPAGYVRVIEPDIREAPPSVDPTRLHTSESPLRSGPAYWTVRITADADIARFPTHPLSHEENTPWDWGVLSSLWCIGSGLLVAVVLPTE